MPKQQLDLIKAIEKQIGDYSFFSTKQLIKLNIFGSPSAVRLALQRGDLSFVKISKKRFIISRNDLIKYLIDNFCGQKKKGANQ